MVAALPCQLSYTLAQGKIRWAMAGRDAKKLELIKQNLVKINPDCEVGLSWERSTASHSL